MPCQDCERLWTTYIELIQDQMALLAECSEAARTRDTGKIGAIESALEAEQTFCKQAWEQLQTHAATHTDRVRSAVA
jgi:hypothetical protein